MLAVAVGSGKGVAVGSDVAVGSGVGMSVGVEELTVAVGVGPTVGVEVTGVVVRGRVSNGAVATDVLGTDTARAEAGEADVVAPRVAVGVCADMVVAIGPGWPATVVDVTELATGRSDTGSAVTPWR